MGRLVACRLGVRSCRMLSPQPLLVDGALLLWGVNHPRAGRPRVGVPDVAAPDAVTAVVAALDERWARSPVGTSQIVLTLPDAAGSLVEHEIDVVRLDPLHALSIAAQLASDTGATEVAPRWRTIARLARVTAGIALRQEFVPTVTRRTDDGAPGFEGRWRPAPSAVAADELDQIARHAPGALFAGRSDSARPRVLTVADRRVAINAWVASMLDALVRERLVEVGAREAVHIGPSLHDRWVESLMNVDPRIAGPPDAVDRLQAEVDGWHERVRRRTESPFRLMLRLEEPDDPSDDVAGSAVWFLRYLLQSRSDPSMVIDLADAWRPTGADARALAREGFDAGMHLLEPLGEAGRVVDAIGESLGGPRPAGCELNTAGAHTFLVEQASQLEGLGIGVQVPAWWRGRRGRFQLNLRAHVQSGIEGGRRSLDSLNLTTIVGYDWRVALGDQELSREELTQLAKQKTPLVRIRGRWVELDADELHAALEHLARFVGDPTVPSRGRSGGEASSDATATATIGELLCMSVGSGVAMASGSLPVGGVTAEPEIETLLAGLAAHQIPDPPPLPDGLRGTLRPYQERGYSWLATMDDLGLGACLADDMGLGKTVQVLAAVLRSWETERAGDVVVGGPTLVVVPTSVLTNWARECARFAPDLPVITHHGPERARGAVIAENVADAAIVLTSYAVLARDAEVLASVAWRRVVLDEAQNMKNPSTRHAQVACSLSARARIALTGTPVENSIGDLWSIMEFLNPGLLGARADFRRTYLLPIQSGDMPEVAQRLRRLVGPFLLRREKTDRAVIDDLPDKFETVEHCAITHEQVGLYEAIVRDAERILCGRAQAGVERRGLILATLAKLKQACNHPAQLLGDGSAIAGRSGKLNRLEELLEQVLDSGERALVFTQFVAMGELLQTHLAATFGREVLFLHGGTSRARRDAMVARFQDPVDEAPPIFVLSLKAGGSGLNLTAASHVFHFDRWWNPATEQQASDRAFRIGQTRDVQVHALVCAGTIEERIDYMLMQKRAVANSVVGSRERWITELDDEELFGLLELRAQTVLRPGRLDDTGTEWRRVSL